MYEINNASIAIPVDPISDLRSRCHQGFHQVRFRNTISFLLFCFKRNFRTTQLLITEMNTKNRKLSCVSYQLISVSTRRWANITVLAVI